MAGALHGLKVIDCTHVLAGAWCSLLLADLGADVIKIEPLGGELMRAPGSRFRPFDYVNRNKRAIAIDIASPAGAETMRNLADTADVFVENYRPGALAKSGLDYETLAARNARLVYASISGFGQTGPYRERGGLDLVAQAMSGLMSVTGDPAAERPVACGVPVSDLNAGTFAALGVLAALNHRNATGEGQYVETSLLETAFAFTIWETGTYLATGAIAQKSGSRHRLTSPYEAYRTGDGFMVVGVNNQSLWKRFCEALGEPALADEPDFAEPRSRLKNRDALQARLEAILAVDVTANWVAKITARGVPCGPINNISEALADPQVISRGVLAEVEGRPFARAPLNLSRTPVGLARGVAAVGEHTHEVLVEAGIDAVAVDRLAADGVIRGVEVAS
ncbi:MAG: CaiB/BaiF CoA-transferase family protein [Caulobacteraceae bacterium]|jgi:formyl-CoA transferase